MHHTGFTTTLTPNTKVHYTTGGRTYDEMDFNSWQEGKNGSAGQTTYAMITSRSYHTGLVQVALLDGSVRSVSDSVDLTVWRSVGTRAGHEVVNQEW